MVGKEITLNKLIAVANGKVASDKEALAKIAAEMHLEGTVEELMGYVEKNQALFTDPNLSDVKMALSNFLKKMSPHVLKLTIVAIRQELEEFKNQKGISEDKSTGPLTQEDLNALLDQIKTDPSEEPSSDEPPSDTPYSPAAVPADPESAIMSQSGIDTLLTALQGAEGAPEQGGEPACSEFKDEQNDGAAHTMSLKQPHEELMNSAKGARKPESPLKAECSEHIDASSRPSSDEEQKQPTPRAAMDNFVSENLDVVIQEKGEAKILKVFYRIYVRDNGSFLSLFETPDQGRAKTEFERVLSSYPSSQVFLGKIIQKEVLVVKEDVRKIPVSVRIEFAE
jgi:hypothetical protein